MSTTTLAIGIGVLVLAGVLIFNTLIRRRNAVENAFAGIDAYLAMRYDLIPNLVETVRGYAKHESETLRRVTELRDQALKGGLGSDERVRLDNRIAHGMLGLLAVAEAYPELRASENFQQLQRALNEVEERLSAARRAFNANVLDLNNAVEIFPMSLVAGALGFRRRAFFESADAARQTVPVGERLRG